MRCPHFVACRSRQLHARRFPTEVLTTRAGSRASCSREGEPAHHALQTARGHRRPRAHLPDAKTLGDRLGCVFFQCPPLQYRREPIEALGRRRRPVPGSMVRDGVPPPRRTEARELRPPSIAWCVAETDEKTQTRRSVMEPAGTPPRKARIRGESSRGSVRSGGAGAGGDVFATSSTRTKVRARRWQTPDDWGPLASGPTPLQVPVRSSRSAPCRTARPRRPRTRGVGHASIRLKRNPTERVDYSCSLTPVCRSRRRAGSSCPAAGSRVEQVERRMDARVHRS